MNLMFYQGTTSGLKYLFFGEYMMAEEAVGKRRKNFKSQFSSLTKSLCEMLENYSRVSFTLADITNQMSMTHAIWKIDKANSFFDQPSRVENAKETKLDYEAIEQYYMSSESIIDLEGKYFDKDDSD